MTCPNCGLVNPDNAKFCANCGTSFSGVSGIDAQTPRYQAPVAPSSASNTTAKNIGIGCLIALVILLLFGLSCTRACFGLRHGRNYVHRRY